MTKEEALARDGASPAVARAAGTPIGPAPVRDVMEDPAYHGTPVAPDPKAALAVEAFLAAVSAVDPTKLVKQRVRQGALDAWLGDREHPDTIHVIALGKAAPRMVWGLVEAGVPIRGVGATVRGTKAPMLDGFTWHDGGHPTPDEGSAAAGRGVLEAVDRLPPGAPVLVLLSGGASACCEATDDLEGLRAKWSAWVRAGLPIEELNRRRADGSTIKGGALARRILARTDKLACWVLDDVPGADARVVGGGPCDAPGVPHDVLAGNEQAVQAAGTYLGTQGIEVYRHAAVVTGDVETEVAAFVHAAHGLPKGAALVGGGEATVALPAVSPPGGRCTHAALLAARHLEDAEVFLAGATDGVDGVPGCSGGWSDAATWDAGAETALAHFDARARLAARDQVFDLGITGTNIADVWILLR